MFHDIKKKIRLNVTNKLSKISQQEIYNRSFQIFKNIQSLRILDKYINIFVYISKKNEVQTFKLIDYLRKINKNIYFPIMNKDKINVVSPKSDVLISGRFNILEPKYYKLIENIGIIDIAFIPGVAFSILKNRIGHGFGYFDRLLSNSKFIKIGLGFDFQIEHFVSSEKNDIDMDIVITEKKIYL